VSAEISTASLIKEAKAFHLKKRLGQHFLVDTDALGTIVDALNAHDGDTVIEVGAGIGFLTRLLARTGANIIAVDLDRESIERLQAANYKNVEIKHGDFLRFDLNAEAPAAGKLRVVGNVPYQITGLIIGHLLGELDKPSPWLQRIENIVLTIQYEVARRIIAPPGDSEYSRVSILVQQYCEVELVQRLPPSSFFPPPEVNSAVIRLVRRAQPAVACRNLQLMRQLVAAGFRQRRKMFRNALGFLRLPQSQVDAVFARLGLDPQVRAERLSLKQFAMLADAFDEMSSNAKANSSSSGEDQSDI
jgi:16S rRNA (adenine1518-N6/adenine1519-N6)-dimethyltransferase